MTPEVKTPWIPPATPAPTRDAAQEQLNSDARLRQRQGMGATELGGSEATGNYAKAGLAATKKLMGQPA